MINRSNVKLKVWIPPDSGSEYSVVCCSMIVPPSMKSEDRHPYEAYVELNVKHGSGVGRSKCGVVVGVKRAACANSGCVASAGGKCVHVSCNLQTYLNVLRPGNHGFRSSPTALLCAWNVPTTGKCFDFLTPLHKLPYTQDDPNNPVKRSRIARKSGEAAEVRRYDPRPTGSIVPRNDSKRTEIRASALDY